MPDLLVAGGGPAGLATAIGAARAGLSTVVVEPRRGTIDKACGEGLLPGAVRELALLKVGVDGHPLRGIRYLDGTRHADAVFRHGPGTGVRRTVLHDALRAAADDAGVRFLHRPLGRLEQDAGGVEAAGLRASWLVAADGLHSPVRRQLALDRPVAGPARWGLRRHFAVAPWTDLVEVHWAGSGAEAYVTPVANNLVGVAVLTSRRGSFDQQLPAFPTLASRLGTAVASPERGAGPLHQRSSRRHEGRVLLVGDAAGYVDALTGEGISVSLASARALVEALVRGDPASYERSWSRISRSYRLITQTLLWAQARPGLRPLIVPAAARFSSVFGMAVDQLAR